MKLIQKIANDNKGIITQCTNLIDKKFLKEGNDKVFSYNQCSALFNNWYKGNISLKFKKLITWAINEILGTSYCFNQKTGVFDLEIEVGEK